MTLSVCADENIPFAEEAFASIGDVRLRPGRSLKKEDLKGIDALMVRSVTRVDAALLEGTSVCFVGTATIGMDHVDRAYLEKQGIGFASAPGCNAVSVSEYIMAAILEMGARHGFEAAGLTLGIVGVGNVGSRVEKKARALGMEVILNDPPLRDASGDHDRYRPLDDILEADIVTFHVPLEKQGPYPTHHMVNADLLKRLKDKGLINASRGSVVDETALIPVLKAKGLRFCVLDVFEHEPAISRELAGLADIISPHIAGYSFEGKLNGTTMVCEAGCRHFGIPSAWDPRQALGDMRPFTAAWTGDREEDLRSAIRLNYDIFEDDRNLRGCLGHDDHGPCFDGLRKKYRIRREFTNTVLAVPPDADQDTVKILEEFGFAIDRESE